MTTDLVSLFREAEECERTAVGAKLTEAAFDRFIDSYENHKRGDQDPSQHLLPFAYNSRGLARYLQVNFDSAVEDFSKAIGLNPSVANFYYNRGLIKFRLKDFDKARVDLEKTLQLEATHDSAKKCLEAMDSMIRHQALLRNT